MQSQTIEELSAVISHATELANDPTEISVSGIFCNLLDLV